MNNKGVTLIELIIYIVLTSLVIVLIGSPFKQMLKNTVAGKSIAKIQTGSRDAMSMLSREIRNTGFKHYTMTPAGVFDSTSIPKTYLPDSSSFELRQGNPNDTLKIYKATINDAGQSTGGVDSVNYYVKNKVLIRNCNGKEINLADNVFALQFRLGVLTKDSLLFEADDFVLGQWTRFDKAAISMDNNDLLVSYSGAGTGSVRSVNTFDIVPAATIKIIYNINNKTGIPGNVDSLRWMILNSTNQIVASEGFKPGITDGFVRIPVPVAVSSAKIQLQAKCNNAASLALGLIQIRAVDRGSLIWSDTVAVKEKKNVKAMKIYLLLRSSSKADAQKNDPIAVANVTVNRSGMYAWRLLTETVEISNNGLF